MTGRRGEWLVKWHPAFRPGPRRIYGLGSLYDSEAQAVAAARELIARMQADGIEVPHDIEPCAFRVRVDPACGADFTVIGDPVD